MPGLSEATAAHVEKQINDLAEEFEGMVSRKTVARLVNESVEGLSAARFDNYVPILVYRFSRERLLALAHSEGTMTIVTSGVALNELVGSEFSLGTVRLRGSSLCEPCVSLVKTQANQAPPAWPRTQGRAPGTDPHRRRRPRRRSRDDLGLWAPSQVECRSSPASAEETCCCC